MGEALEKFRLFLRDRSLRMTEARETVVKIALEQRGHFDVDELVAEAERRGLEASRATVYRLLPLLMEAGIVQHAVVSGERRRYEAAFGQEHHDHLICRRCGKVVEFHFEAFEMLQREIAAKYDFELTGHFHELIGICGACRSQSQS